MRRKGKKENDKNDEEKTIPSEPENLSEKQAMEAIVTTEDVKDNLMGEDKTFTVVSSPKTDFAVKESTSILSVETSTAPEETSSVDVVEETLAPKKQFVESFISLVSEESPKESETQESKGQRKEETEEFFGKGKGLKPRLA